MNICLSQDTRYRIATRGREVVVLFRDAVKEFLTDNCLHLSASISYYMFFCIFPLSLAFISILGFILGSPESEAKVIGAIGDFLPVSSEFITSTIRDVVRARGSLGVIATLGLLWGGSAVFNVLRRSVNIAWGIKKPRPFLAERAMELTMTLGVGLLLLISIAITTALEVVQQFNATVIGIEFLNGVVFWQVSLMLLSMTLAFATFLLIYKFVPYTRVRWRDVMIGALLAAVGFEATKQIFVWYVTHHAHHHLIFGPVGTIIALLIWAYISAVIVLFCAKLTSVYSRSRRSAVEFSTWRSRQRVGNRRYSLGHLSIGGTGGLPRDQ